MSEQRTVQIGGQPVALRRWGIHPGWQFCGVIGEIVLPHASKILPAVLSGEMPKTLELEITQETVRGLFSVGNELTARDMVIEGVAMERSEVEAALKTMPFDEFLGVLTEVVKYNLGFIKATIVSLLPRRQPVQKSANGRSSR